jgi:hypothetical protein
MAMTNRQELHKIAQAAGIKVPFEASAEADWDEFPHYSLFCTMQSHSEVPHKEAYIANAKLIAGIDEDLVHLISKNKLLKMGFVVGRAKENGNGQSA